MNSRKALRIVSWSVGGLCLAILALLVSIYFILRTPSMQAKILQSIREPLAAAGIEPTIERLSIDLLGGVSLDGLDLKIKRPPLAQGEIQLAQLRLRYGFWPLLQRRLEIRELHLEGIRGTLRLELPPPAEPAPAEPLDLKALLEQLRHPPVTVDIPAIELRDINLQLQVIKGPLQADTDIQAARFSAAVQVHPGLVDLKVDALLPLQLSLSMQGQGEGEADAKSALQLKSKISVGLNPHFVLKLDDEQLSWQVDWPDLALQLDALQLEQTGPAGQLTVDLPAFNFKQSVDLEHQALLPAEPQLAHVLWPLTVDLQQNAAIAPLQLQQIPAKAPAAQRKAGGGKAPKVAAPAPMRVQLKAGLDNHLKATLPSLEALQDAAWTLATDLQLNALKIQQGDKLLAQTPQLRLKLTGEGEKGKGAVTTDLQGQELVSAFLKAPLNLRQLVEAQVNLGRKELHLQASHVLNDFDLLQLRLDVEDPTDSQLTSKLEVNLKTDPRLLQLHAGAAILPKIGYPSLHLEQTMGLTHPMPLFKIQGSDLDLLTITNSLTADIVQSNQAGATLARFENLRIEEQAKWIAKELLADLEIKVEGLSHAALLRQVNILQKVTVQGKGGDQLKGTLTASTQLGAAELMTLKAEFQDLVGKAIVKSELLLKARPELQKELAALKVLDDTGAIQIKSVQTVDIAHGAASVQKMKGFDLKKVTIDAQLEQTISSLGEKPSGKYRLLQPLRIESRAKLVRGRADLNTKVMAPSLEAQDLAQVKDLRVGVIASLSDLDEMALAEAKVVVQVAGVDLLGELAKKPELKGLLRQIQVILHATLERKENLHIKNLFAALQHPFVQFRGKGDLALSGRGDFTGKLEVTMPEEARAGIKGKGRFLLPLQITIYDKQKIAVQAEPRFQAFSLEFGDLNVQNVQGSVQVREELSLDKKGKIGFLYLNTQNPFVRVDYESVEPYVGNPTILSIDKIRFKHIELGPIVENFEVRQNLVYLNDFKADLLGGSTLGRLYFDLHPDRLQLGFLGRFSNLQPELLKEPGRRNSGDKAFLSGRMGSSFDIRQRLASGRIDITSIGRQQLSSLLDVLDPEYKDSQIATARRAIQVAYPRFVSISMNQGLMDLTIGMGGAISKDIYIRSIPLSALINAQLGTTLQRIETIVQEGES